MAKSRVFTRRDSLPWGDLGGFRVGPGLRIKLKCSRLWLGPRCRVWLG